MYTSTVGLANVEGLSFPISFLCFSKSYHLYNLSFPLRFRPFCRLSFVHIIMSLLFILSLNLKSQSVFPLRFLILFLTFYGIPCVITSFFNTVFFSFPFFISFLHFTCDGFLWLIKFLNILFFRIFQPQLTLFTGFSFHNFYIFIFLF